MSHHIFTTALRLLTTFALTTSFAFAQVPEGLLSSEWTSIRAAYEDGRQRVFEVDGGFEARSHRQQYVSRFDGRGLSIAPDDASWSFDLTLTAYGRGDDVVSVSSPMEVAREARRIEYRWDERVTEWYVNGDDGLEHGFTVASAPSGSADLEFVLEVQGGLRGEVDLGSRGVTFADDQGRDAVHYRGLLVVDATGAALDAHITCAGSKLTLHVDDSSALYPIVIDPIIQQAFLAASVQKLYDGFGSRVAIDGDTLVVGVQREDSNATGVNGNQGNTSATSAGAAYVFTRSGSSWVQEAYLKASNTDEGDLFGWSVAIDGNTVVVGAHYEDSSATGVNGNQADNSSDRSGAVYVFTRSGSTWTQEAYLKASNTGLFEGFGSSVAIDGDTLVVGTPWEDSNSTGVNGDQANDLSERSGAAFVFTRSGTTWLQEAYIKASNTGESDQFGTSVAIDGDTVVVGAHDEDSAATGVNGVQTDDSATLSGAAYVFTRSGTTWTQQAYLKASNTDAYDYFGRSVAIDLDTVVVAAAYEASSATGVDGNQANNSAFIGSGAVYVFTRSSSAWTQQAYLKASNTDQWDVFGTSVAIDGATVAVGAPGEDGDSVMNTDVGAVYIFDLDLDWRIIAGCHGNTASYVLPSTPAQINTTVPIDLLGSVVSNGIVATYYGATGIDGFGCGLLLAPTEELLLALAPFPTFHSLSVMTGGLATIPLTVPNNSSIVGFVVTLQSVAIDTTTFASEFSDALEFVIRP